MFMGNHAQPEALRICRRSLSGPTQVQLELVANSCLGQGWHLSHAAGCVADFRESQEFGVASVSIVANQDQRRLTTVHLNHEALTPQASNIPFLPHQEETLLRSALYSVGMPRPDMLGPHL